MKIDAPLVTVVTPVLNRVGTLARCLDSVAAQTYPYIEHIVVDGGSDDGTVEMLEERAGSRLRFTTGPDRGMYDAINKGLRTARGEVLAYLNSDDAYLPWTLETAVAGLRDGADMVFGDLIRVERHADGTASVSLQFYPPFDLNHYTHVSALAQPTVVWRRGISDRLGFFDDSYRLLGDCEYWLRAGAAGYRIDHLAEFQAVQIDHAGTLRVTEEPQMRAEFRRLRSDYHDVAGPPRSAVMEHALRSLRWRRDQLRLTREMIRRRPRAWPRFISFLREHQVDVDRSGLLLFQLPQRLRPASTTWLDAVEFEAGLDAAIAQRVG